MSPDEAIAAVAARGFEVSRRTLSLYAQKGLIPAPEVHGLGRGLGASSEFPAQTPAEVIAAKALIGVPIFPIFRLVGSGREDVSPGRRIKAEDIAEARRRAYRWTVADWTSPDHGRATGEELFLSLVIAKWLSIRRMILDGLPSPPRFYLKDLSASRSGQGGDTRLVDLKGAEARAEE